MSERPSVADVLAQLASHECVQRMAARHSPSPEECLAAAAALAEAQRLIGLLRQVARCERANAAMIGPVLVWFDPELWDQLREVVGP